MKSVIITIQGWTKYNPRQDVKNPTWFRLNHDIIGHDELFDFSHAEIVAWLYLLCQASRKSAATFTLNVGHAIANARLSEAELSSAINKLIALEYIATAPVTRPLRGRDADVTETCTTNERTNERTDSAVAPLSDPPVPKKTKAANKGGAWTKETLVAFATETLACPAFWAERKVGEWLEYAKFSDKKPTKGYWANWVASKWRHEKDDVEREEIEREIFSAVPPWERGTSA
jgi:hypothetical protein